MNESSYYQAIVERSACWYVVAVLRSFEHTAFDRTIDIAASKFEFFVPVSMEEPFCAIMNYFQEQGLVSNLVKLPNRLTVGNEPVWPDARW
ncbi:hypothetical protein JST99_03280 [Candidatus Dependentiae bacterium]|nr:hypothetical protein [Candidatus Dependentiae bacterium]MCC7415115.1 hypothetical protein [Campylobacterota bacterium]